MGLKMSVLVEIEGQATIHQIAKALRNYADGLEKAQNVEDKNVAQAPVATPTAVEEPAKKGRGKAKAETKVEAPVAKKSEPLEDSGLEDEELDTDSEDMDLDADEEHELEDEKELSIDDVKLAHKTYLNKLNKKLGSPEKARTAYKEFLKKKFGVTACDELKPKQFKDAIEKIPEV